MKFLALLTVSIVWQSDNAVRFNLVTYLSRVVEVNFGMFGMFLSYYRAEEKLNGKWREADVLLSAYIFKAALKETKDLLELYRQL